MPCATPPARSILEDRFAGQRELEGADFWRGVRTTRDMSGGVAAFVQPALIEDKPRKLLAALASGIPVIATRECGLLSQAGLSLVPAGESEALARVLCR